MKKILAVQISALIIISGALGGMLFFTDIYDDVQSNIVEILCLSCLKLKYKTSKEFTFKTANMKSHPDFVLDNLTQNPIFLYYSEDACPGCDIMHPVIEEFFNIEFGKQEMFFSIVDFEGSNVAFYHTNIDHASEIMRNSIDIYDKDHVGGLPMFTIITLGYEHGSGNVNPYYTSLYSAFLDTYDERIDFFTVLMRESINLYTQNKAGYKK